MNFQSLKPVVKYAIVGVVGTLIDLFVLYLLVEFCHFPVLVGTTISFVVSVINNFVWNKAWTFRNTSANYRKLFIKFLLVSLGGLILTNLIMGILVHGIDVWYIHAKLVTSAVVLMWNFLMNKYWTFKVRQVASSELQQYAFEYSIIVPAYNEEGRIVETLRRIDQFRSASGNLSAEIIVVDDGSRDATCDRVQEEAKRIRDLRLVKSQKNMGKGHAVRLGVFAANGGKILFTDADNSTPIHELEALNKAIRLHGSDIAIGSRYLHQSRVEIRQSFFRIAIGRVGNLLVRWFVISGIHDSQCGFKMFQHAAAKDIFSRCKVNRWGFDIEILAIADMLDYKITEVPVSWFNSSESRLRPVRDAIYTFFELIMIKLNLWSGRYEIK